MEVVRGAAGGDVQAVLGAVSAALKLWTGGAPNRDDITLLGVKAGVATPP